MANLFGAKPNGACPAYINFQTATEGYCLEGRLHCEDLWHDYEPLADPNFLTDFPLHLHERWFEMYLTVALVRSGLNVTCPKPGPDICLTVDGRKIWIEATCASPGAPGKPDSVPELHVAGPGEVPIASQVPVRQITLRICNSVAGKEAAFRNYLSAGIVTSNDVLVIAINTHEVRQSLFDTDKFMLRALYGVGNLMVAIDPSTGAKVDQRYEQQVSIAKSSTGQPVGVRPFADGSLPHISAVIGSGEDALNRPTRFGDGLTIFPNLTASTQWPRGTIECGQEWTFAEVANEWHGAKVSHIS